MKQSTFRFLDNLGELFAPVKYKCLSCGKDVFDSNGFCSECSKNVVFNNGKTCKRCGVGIDGEEDYCGNCSFDKIYFDKAYSVFSYEGAVKEAILKMKFANKGSYAKVFARYLVFICNKYDLAFDLVTFTPMSVKSKRQRRYNQSELLARYFCDILDCNDKLAETLIKVKETARQENCNRQQRKENLIGAYKANGSYKGKSILVIDDVKTTGATLNECAKVLKRAGATSVTGLTVSARKEHVQFEVESEL